MGNDFFEELDGKISALQTAEAAKAEQNEANLVFAKQALIDLRPVADEYVGKLRERGIAAKVRGDDSNLSFQMQWADHADHGLSIYPELETNRLKISRNSTDHTDGKPFRSTDITTHDATTWSPSTFENALKSVIRDYMSAADKHGGIA